MALTADNFCEACSAFVQKYSNKSHDEIIRRRGLTGWSWIPHSTWPAFGYMTRVTPTKAQDSSLGTYDEEQSNEEEDLESLSPSVMVPSSESPRLFQVIQYVVYSASFQVPAFYFVITDEGGTTLSLEQTVRTALFRPGTLSQSAIRDTHIELGQAPEDSGSSVFPLLSQGEHPLLQTNCWYLHPCETPSAMKELWAAQQAELTNGETMGKEKWLEAWFLLLGSILDLEE
ncbi:hypothetical protein CPB86DRAFT_812614 [Serendipita vermifera]|nr:hypothetical protein CPB86DRAFT_812614 [Serendipita vermifera]